MAPTQFTIPPGTAVVGQSNFVEDIDNLYTAVGAIAGINVMDSAYGAVGDGVTDDTSAIQAALTAAAAAGGGTVLLPAGTFLISSALTISTGTTLAGAGMNTTVIKQSSTTADTLTCTDQRYITVRDIQLNGPGSGTGTGRGIAFLFSASAIASIDLHNMRVLNFPGRGVYLDVPITSRLANIRVENCGDDYFYLTGGTSCVLDNCYADGASVGAVNGYTLNAMCYTTLNACAADSIVGSGTGGGSGYLVSGGSSAITFNSCGNESSAIGFKVTGSRNVMFNACRVYAETTFGWVITSSSTGVIIAAPVEQSPNGASNSIKVDSGSSARILNPALVTATQILGSITGIPAAPFGSTPNGPTGTASTTLVMSGLGSTWTYTPASSGNLLITIAGSVTTATGAVLATFGARYGTGTAPVNGAAVTGTRFGTVNDQGATPVAAGETVAFAQTAVLSLTPGTAYWFDLALKTSNSSDTASFTTLSISIVETS